MSIKIFFKQTPVFYKITVSQLYSLTIIKFLLQPDLVKIKENLLELISQPIFGRLNIATNYITLNLLSLIFL